MKKLFLFLSFGVWIFLSINSSSFASDIPQDRGNIDEEKPKFTISSGQPPTTFWSLGGLGSYSLDNNKGGFQLYLKIRKNLFLKQFAFLNWEGTVGVDSIGKQLSPSIGGYLNLLYLTLDFVTVQISTPKNTTLKNLSRLLLSRMPSIGLAHSESGAPNSEQNGHQGLSVLV